MWTYIGLAFAFFCLGYLVACLMVLLSREGRYEK
jgi:hypothetical protein